MRQKALAQAAAAGSVLGWKVVRAAGTCRRRKGALILGVDRDPIQKARGCNTRFAMGVGPGSASRAKSRDFGKCLASSDV